MICPNCRTEVSDSMKFCENCGAALPASNAQPQDAFSPNASQQQNPTQPASHMRTTDPYADAPQFDQQPSGTYADAPQFGQQPINQPYADVPQSGQQVNSQPYAAPTSPGTYAPVNTSPQPSSAPFVLAIIALVTSILGLFPISIILAIIALVMNSGQKKRGELSTKQSPTTIMSIISLVISAIMLVLTIMVGGLMVAYLASGDFNSSLKGNGISLTSTKSSSASAGAAGSAGSSASSPNAPAGINPEVIDKLQGTWKLTGLVSNGEVMSPESIEQMQNMGLTVELALGVDGSATLTLFGADMNGTWESSDGNNVSLKLDGISRINATVTDGALTFTEGSDELSFTKQ